jgi:type I restriction enzyme S subunit
MSQEVKKRIDQIRHGIVPEGYRKAGTDIIPSDWDKSPFRQLGVIASGLVDPQKQPYSEMQHIGPDCIEKDTGRIFETKSASELRLISGKFYFDSDSIVYSKIRPNLNKVCAPPFEGICSADCYSIKPTGKIEKAYLFNLMLGYNFYKRAVACSMRTGMPKINQDDLNNIDISYPKSTTEQKKIAEILTTQDKVIVLEQQKIEEIIKEKQFFLEKMFPKKGEAVPEIRFKGFTDPWEQRKAKELFVSTADKGYPELPVLSATQDRGMIRRDENSINIFHDKKNETGYKRVLPGQFVIHLRSFQGGFAHSTIEGITSPAYTVFGFSEPEKHNSEYWKYVFTSKAFIRRLETVTYGIRDGRSISYDEFLTLSFAYPSKVEQTTIARYLDKLSDLITLHQRKLEEEKKKKKALMQLLLTGIVRV